MKKISRRDQARLEIAAARRTHCSIESDQFEHILLDYEISSSWWAAQIYRLPFEWLRDWIGTLAARHFIRKTKRKFKLFRASREARSRMEKASAKSAAARRAVL